MGCIYALYRESEPNEYRYIGKTSYPSPSKRFKAHLNNASCGDTAPVYRWIRKYEDIAVITIEDNIDNSLACEKEKHYIRFYKKAGHRLLNSTEGGDGSPGRKLSISSKEKIRSKLKGRSLSEAHKRNISLGQTGRKLSDKTKNKISQSLINHPKLVESGKKNKGKKHSLEARKKISLSKKGKPATEKQLRHLAKLAKANKNRVRRKDK